MDRNNKRPGRKLKSASQAEILRSHQRDDDFVKRLREQFVDLLQICGRQKGFLRFVHSDIPFRLIYFVFTTGMGNQTIGEEYTGIVQANSKARKVPLLTVRIAAAMLECFGEKTLLYLLKRLQALVNDPHSELTPTAVALLNAFLSKIQNTIPVLILIHKGLFYMYGRYYSLGKRISRIDYAKVHGHGQSDGVAWALRLLGIATLVQCALKIWQSNGDYDANDRSTAIDGKQAKRTCQLCLENVPTTTTPCGHLFCWHCIGDWLSTKPQCPFCREYVTPSRIVYVMNL